MKATALAHYLFKEQYLPLVGMGALRIIYTKPAYDVTVNAISAPDYQYGFENDAEPSGVQQLVRSIGVQFDLSEEEAFDWYHGFLQDIKLDLKTKGKYNWVGIGSFEQNPAGKLSFKAYAPNMPMAQPMQAIRIMEAQRTVEVLPEAETTNETETTFTEKNLENRWLIGAAIVFIATAIVIYLRLAGKW